MTRIGLMSDTHGYYDPLYEKYFKDCDEVWHAGDIGDLAVTDKLNQKFIVKAVYGNIDNHTIRAVYPEVMRFHCEEVDVLIKHIGGYPGNYDWSVRQTIKDNPPKLFITGHSHILKVMPDKKLDLLHMNPGAAGKAGFHKVRTLLRFTIDGKDIKDLEVVEMGVR